MATFRLRRQQEVSLWKVKTFLISSQFADFVNDAYFDRFGIFRYISERRRKSVKIECSFIEEQKIFVSKFEFLILLYNICRNWVFERKFREHDSFSSKRRPKFASSLK